MSVVRFFFQAEDGIRDLYVTGVQTCALPILDLVAAQIRDQIEVPGVDLIRPVLPEEVGQRVRRATELLHNAAGQRSEEHTSELQSRRDLVCRLLLEKKNNI